MRTAMALAVCVVILGAAQANADGWPDTNNGIDILGGVGMTFWVGSNEDDPEFDEFVSRITDGIPDNVQAQFGMEGMGGGFSYWIPIYIVRGWPDRGDYNFDHADLHGYCVERIGLTVDSASYTYVSGAEYPHQYAWETTYIFEGTPIPEPASLAGVAVGIGVLAGLRSRGRRPYLKS